LPYRRTTRGITVSVEPEFLADRSEPDEDRFVWAYTVEIVNGSPETVQLLARHWMITDANGKLDEVRGPGVVGEQPVIEPGERFGYTSACPLPTPSGIMVGSYRMRTATGLAFDVDVPAFSLDSPHAQRTLN
jgi:ApaG protein